jgi:tyrosinase
MRKDETMSRPGAVLIRREISGLAANHPIVTGYAQGVKRMQERHPDDPTSWSYQAAIHGSLETPARNLWNQCQHATWYFLPWHRMYLYYFERIVRAAIIEAGGPPDWTLPYWNYCLGQQHAFLPAPFRTPPAGEHSPLYVPERDPKLNSGDEGMPDYVTTPRKALERPHFVGKAEFGGPQTGFQHSGETFGALENSPHNAVHVFVKGLMKSPETAAQDPIFWLHHANIDRLWSQWIATGAGHEDPPEEGWRNFSFTLYDEHGHEVSMRCEQVLQTATDLGYIYDSEQAPQPPPLPPQRPTPRLTSVTAQPQEMIGATQEGVTLIGEQITVSVPIAQAAAEGFGEQVHAYLNVEEIEAAHNPGVTYLVYADLEGGEAPHPDSPHYLGTLSFFGVERARNPVGDAAPHALQASYDITPIARELEAQGKWAGHEFPVTFAPLNLVGPDAGPTDGIGPAPHGEQPVRLGRLSVFYDA